jgi:hypothetical protein
MTLGVLTPVPGDLLPVERIRGSGRGRRDVFLLVMDAGSICGILYVLSEALSIRMSDGVMERCSLAAQLVEILKPMAMFAGLSPPDRLSDADTTLHIGVVDESRPSGEEA